ncbi:copper resistance protein CopC [Streptomyces sp. RY43-2]|uniref:Copper resistance protein CopC n=1 Tax=Streptomyces macrolidinus TaxID=2952607 RepID=A0ABT0ZHQ6_9ACTN|nr:copper resistance protein CopC [Streptomyces macrolidinus]MCN9243119.1 copper resistance protein CopC [Streptomyces macrolidinus]
MVLLLAVAGALLGGAAPASAHAALTGSDPAQGAVVDTAPTRISLTFSEQVAFSDGSLRVLDPKGGRVDTGKPVALKGTTYGVKLRAGLSDGTYTVTYQVVSADSHPVAGAFTFSIGAPSATTVQASGQAVGGGVVGGLYGLARYVAYAGFVVLVGGAAFVLACWPRGAGVRAVQRLVAGGWVALTAATLALLLLRGSYTGSGKAADVFDLSLLGQVLETKSGAALVSRLLLLAVAALFLAVLFGAYAKRDAKASGTVEQRDLTLGLALGGTAVAAGLATTWAVAEHASTGIQAGVAMPVDVLHLLAVAAWLGGLTALLVALYRGPSVDAAAVRRFSQVAFTSVIVLAATGIYQSWRQVGSWPALTGTTYGQLLLAKVGLIAVLVAIARISRRWTAQLAQQPAEVARPKSATAAAKARPKGAASRGQGAAASGKKVSGKRDSDKGTSGKGASGRRGAGTAQDSSGSRDPRRAAQLARQQAAMAAARTKQLRDADPLRSGLRRSVLAEAGVAVVLLAVTTALTSTEPGRTEEAVKAATPATAQASGPVSLRLPFDTGGQDGRGTVDLTLDPARVGGNDLHVFVVRPNGKAFDVPEVKIAFTLKAKGIGPLPITPEHITTGHWSKSGVQIPMAGDWEIAVTVRTSDIDQVTVNKNAKIG